MKTLLPLFFASLLFFACSMENDELFVPSTQRAYFLLEEKESGQKRICEVLDSSLYCDVAMEPTWDIKEEIVDMAGYGDWLYVLTDESAIYGINLSENPPYFSWRTNVYNANPSSIAAGEKYLLLGDSLNKQLIFVRHKQFNLGKTHIFVDKTPGKAIYRSGKFFVPMDSTWLESWHETGFSMLNEIEVGHPIMDIQANNRTSIVMLMKDGGEWRLGSVDWNNLQWLVDPQKTIIRHLRTTPYFRSAYEKEWLRDIQVDTTRRLFLTKNIRGMEVDFFESNVYFLSNDTLEKYNIRSRELTKMGTLRGDIVASYFYIGH